MPSPRRLILLAALAAALGACGDNAPSPTGPGGTDCPPDKTYFYCSNTGYACEVDDDCCASMTCDPATRACTDGGLTRVDAGFRCSQNTLCVDHAQVNEHTDRVACQGGICEWADASRAYCSEFSQACNRDSDCCGKLWCDQSAGQCTDGISKVGSGYRCSDRTLCKPSETIGGKDRSLFCDSDGICKYEPYCAQ